VVEVSAKRSHLRSASQSMSKKGARQASASAKPKSKSKWTPDLMDASHAPSRDDEILARLGSKLGVTDEAIPQAFVDDGLDYLLKLPRYEQMRGADAGDDSDEAPQLLAETKPKKKKSKRAAETEAPADEIAKKKKKKKTAAEGKKSSADEPAVAVEEKKINPKETTRKKKTKPKNERMDDDADPMMGEEDAGEELDDPDAVLAALQKQKAAKARPRDEIDDLFSTLGDAKKKKKKKSAGVPKQDAKRVPRDDNDGFAGRSLAGKGGRKYTEEGFPIYTTDELGLNDKGGDTPDCPFDCNCCH